MSYERELEAAVAAVRAASKVCVAVQRDLVTAETLEKKDKSPVTVADFASQAVVCAALSEQLPDDPVVGEEGSAELRMDEAATLSAIDRGAFDPADDASVTRYWTLDPIDGTKGFLRGQQYAVALGLIENGQVVLGVLGCPNLEGGVVMTAVKGGGSKRLPLEGEGTDGQTVNVTATNDPASARVCESVESGHTKQDASAEVSAKLGIGGEPFRIDSQCKYAAVAMGLAEVYLRLPTRPGYVEKIWDHAAGKLVVEEAGGTVTDVTGKPLDFGKGRGLTENKGVICTNGPFHAKVVATVRDVMGL